MKTVLMLLLYLHFLGNNAGLEMTSYRFLKRVCFSTSTNFVLWLISILRLNFLAEILLVILNSSSVVIKTFFIGLFVCLFVSKKIA